MIVVYDLETLCNCTTCVTVDIDTLEERQFVIHKSRNDFPAFVKHVKQCKGMIGFNNVKFDYPVIDEFLSHYELYKQMEGDRLAKKIYRRAQQIIKEEIGGSWNPIIPQRDLFRIWHFHNKARSTSLKWLQICMGWPNVQDMPIDHTEKVTEDMIPTILSYNRNDVLSTLEFYRRSKPKIELRHALSKKYGVDMGNFPDTKIGEEIFLLGLSSKMGMSRKNLMMGRTPRADGIRVADFLLDTIKFESKEFQRVHDYYKHMLIVETKGLKPFQCVFDGVTYEFGLGGLHGFRESGLYYNVLTCDVNSYYPNLAISQHLAPAHLGEPFCQVYKQIYDLRKQYPKGTAENAAFKLALNAVFGASNADWSPFYDPQFTMSVTILGQLILAMLCEQITLAGAGNIVMANTDGIEIMPVSHGLVELIASEWEETFNLQLEFNKYKVLGARDVNNYIAVYENGKSKEKGDYEVEKELFKDQSMRIVPIAVRDYFTRGIPVIETIRGCRDIGKFLIGIRCKTGQLHYRYAPELGMLVDEALTKNNRYYISHTGGSIVRVTTKERKRKGLVKQPNQLLLFDAVSLAETIEDDHNHNLHKGYPQQLFNLWVDKPFEEYGVNLQFYENQALRLINHVTSSRTVIQ